MSGPEVIPLEIVAPDARAAIAAFRNAGGRSFQHFSVEEARAMYRTSCEANGPAIVHLPVVRDHAIDVGGGGIALREYRPSKAATLPLILFIHGGGWVIGDLDTHDRICRQLAATSGAAVIAIDYRLAPEHAFPRPLDDCVAALSWVEHEAQRLGLDLSSVALVGDSAGGNMASVLAGTKTLRPVSLDLKALALIYPVTDLRGKTTSYGRISDGVPLTGASMSWFAGHYLAEGADRREPLVSPLLAEDMPEAPTFIVTCGLDPLADEGIAYAAALAHRGTMVEHHHLPHHAHGILTSSGKIATGQRILARTGAFLGEHLFAPSREA